MSVRIGGPKRSLGQLLYDRMCEEVSELGVAQRMELAAALNEGSLWRDLSPDVQAAIGNLAAFVSEAAR